MSDATFTACGSCNRGGNGNDKDKCACGWQEYDITSKGCFCGTAIEGPIKPRPKLTRSKRRYERWLKFADCFECFRDFLMYESKNGECH